jgi:hypothetical protein
MSVLPYPREGSEFRAWLDQKGITKQHFFDMSPLEKKKLYEDFQEDIRDVRWDDDIHLASNQRFKAAWDAIVKAGKDGRTFAQARQQVVDSLEAGDDRPLPPPLIYLSGNKSNRHYQNFLRQAFDKLGRSNLIEPFTGAAGVPFAVRAPETTLSNELAPLNVNFFHHLLHDPDALRYDPKEVFGFRAGDLMPHVSDWVGDDARFTQKDIDIWRNQFPKLAEQLDGDKMISTQLGYLGLRDELNSLMHDPKGNTPEGRRRLAQLFAILQPQMMQGWARYNPTTGSLNMPPRGPLKTGEKRANLQRDFPEIFNRNEELIRRLNEARKAAPRMQGEKFKAMGTQNIMLPHRVEALGSLDEVDYKPWSDVMRQGDWNIYQGDFGPFLDYYASNMANPETDMLVSDSPYLGAPGQHVWPQSEQERLHEKLGRISRLGVPTVAFNAHSDLIRRLNEEAGLDHRFFKLIKVPKGITPGIGPTVMDKGKPRSVVETIGTNIPMLTDEVISDLSGWPEKERPRGFNLSTGYQLTGDI